MAVERGRLERSDIVVDSHTFTDAVRATNQYYYGCVSFSYRAPPRPLTAEEAEAARVQSALFARRRAEAQGAEARALALLRARLGTREAALFTRTGKLMRPSRLWPGTEYLIPGDGHSMVQVIRDGRRDTELCVIAGEGEPWPDRTMAILDLIESGQERRLWEMANVFPQELTAAVDHARRYAPPRPASLAKAALVLAGLLGWLLVGLLGWGWRP